MKRTLVSFLALIALACASGIADAQINPGTLTLSISPTACKSGCVPTLTWSTTPDPDGTPAQSCTASGAWSGTQPTSGSFTSPALKTSSVFTLVCTWSDSTATYTWTAPTLNTDGSTITLLPLTYNLYCSSSSTQPFTTKTQGGITTLSYQQTGLAAGTEYCALTTVDSAGDESAQTNPLMVVTGTVTATATANVTITVTPATPGSFSVIISK